MRFPVRFDASDASYAARRCGWSEDDAVQAGMGLIRTGEVRGAIVAGGGLTLTGGELRIKREWLEELLRSGHEERMPVDALVELVASKLPPLPEGMSLDQERLRQNIVLAAMGNPDWVEGALDLFLQDRPSKEALKAWLRGHLGHERRYPDDPDTLVKRLADAAAADGCAWVDEERLSWCLAAAATVRGRAWSEYTVELYFGGKSIEEISEER